MGYSEPFHLKDVGKNNILLYLVANRFGVNKSYCLALYFNSSFDIGIFTSIISSSFVANIFLFIIVYQPPLYLIPIFSALRLLLRSFNLHSPHFLSSKMFNKNSSTASLSVRSAYSAYCLTITLTCSDISQSTDLAFLFFGSRNCIGKCTPFCLVNCNHFNTPICIPTIIISRSHFYIHFNLHFVV